MSNFVVVLLKSCKIHGDVSKVDILLILHLGKKSSKLSDFLLRFQNCSVKGNILDKSLLQITQEKVDVLVVISLRPL